MSSSIDPEALVELVRQAMASGAASFVERVAAGNVDMAAPLSDAFGDFPAEFLAIRRDLVDALAIPVGGEDKQQ